MKKTQYYTASSLDGFIATEDHSLEWLFQLGDVEDTGYSEFIKEVGALAMGSSTYEWMLRHVIKLGTEAAAPWPYSQPTWVFSSRSLPSVPGVNLHFARGDVRPVHDQMALAAGTQNIWLAGGGDLVGQFHDAGAPGRSHCPDRVGDAWLWQAPASPPDRLPSIDIDLGARHRARVAELRYDVPRTSRADQFKR